MGPCEGQATTIHLIYPGGHFYHPSQGYELKQNASREVKRYTVSSYAAARQRVLGPRWRPNNSYGNLVCCRAGIKVELL
eukprot:13571350-Ditylum_brightwellii.AAC.1